MSKLSGADKTKEEGEDIFCWDHFIDWNMPACYDIVRLAYHTCLKGPVHVNKWVSSPNLSVAERFKEAGYPRPITDAAWMKFCEAVARDIDCSLYSVKQSTMFKKYGKLWPGCNTEFVKDGLSLAIKRIENINNCLSDSDESSDQSGIGPILLGKRRRFLLTSSD